MNLDKFLVLSVGAIIAFNEFTVGFECILTHTKTTEGSTFSDFTKLRVRKLNRTSIVLVGNITYFVDVGNEHQLEVNIFKKIGNQYQLTPYHMRKENYWDFVKDHDSYKDLRAVSNLPEEDVCPWPKGTYEIYGYNINVDRVPPSFDGDYMMETTVYMDDKVVSVEQMFGTIMGSNGWTKPV